VGIGAGCSLGIGTPQAGQKVAPSGISAPHLTHLITAMFPPPSDLNPSCHIYLFLFYYHEGYLR
jgi:hypothetical protein